MSSFRRISAGAGANVLNLVYVTVITALTVPVLIHAWGVGQYGTWVMVTAIPTYLSLSDFGFATAATNEIAMSVARRDYDQAVKTLHSVWAMNLIVSAIIVGLAVTAGVVMSVFKLQPELALVVPVLAAYAASCLLSRVTLGAFRGGGRYATGTLLYDGLQFIEGALCLLAAWLGGGFLAAASVLLVVRSISILISYITLRNIAPGLPLGLRHASLARLKQLLAPAFASMAVPVALALNMQGVALILGGIVSPTATATLSATRTVSRIAVQVISAVNRALVPELSAASAKGDLAARERILRFNRLLLLGLAVPAAMGFIAFGGKAISIWTSGRIHPPLGVMFSLGAAMAIHCVWFFGTNMLSATNAHSRMAVGLFICSIATVLLAIPLTSIWGIHGAAASVLVGETLCASWYFISSGRSKKDSPSDSLVARATQ